MDIDSVAKVHGDEDSLFRALTKRAFGMARALRLYDHDAEDSVQDGLTLMVPKVRADSALLDEDKAALLLWGIMQYRLSEVNRHRRVEWKNEAELSREIEENWSRTGNPAYDMAMSQLRGLLFTAMNELKPELEEVMVMYWVEGMEVPAIASELEESPDQISRMLYRARKKLEKHAELRAFFDEWEPQS